MLTICYALQTSRALEEAFRAGGVPSDGGADGTQFHALVRIFRRKVSYEGANCHLTGEGRRYPPIPSCTQILVPTMRGRLSRLHFKNGNIWATGVLGRPPFE